MLPHLWPMQQSPAFEELIHASFQQVYKTSFFFSYRLNKMPHPFNHLSDEFKQRFFSFLERNLIHDLCNKALPQFWHKAPPFFFLLSSSKHPRFIQLPRIFVCVCSFLRNAFSFMTYAAKPHPKKKKGISHKSPASFWVPASERCKRGCCRFALRIIIHSYFSRRDISAINVGFWWNLPTCWKFLTWEKCFFMLLARCVYL